MKIKAPPFLHALFRRGWVRWLAIGSVGAVLLYILVGFLGVPLVLRHVVLARINEQVIGTLELGKVRFNPFSWKLEVHDFRALDADGREAASFAEFRVRIRPVSMLRKDKVVREIFWDQPRCTLSVDAGGRINLASVFGRKVPREKPDTEPFVLPSLLVEHLEVRNAGLHLRLDNLAQPLERRIDNLSFVMKDLRTSPESENPYRFGLATNQGEQLAIEGSLRFDPLSSAGKVTLEALQLPGFSGFGNSLTEARITSGELDLQLDYHFHPLAERPEFGIDNARMEIRNFTLATADGSRDLHHFDRLELDGIEFDIVGRMATAESLAIHGAALLLERSADGSLALLPAASSKPSSSPDAEGPKQARPLTLGVIAADRDIGTSLSAASRHIRSLRGGEGDETGLTVRLKQIAIHDSALRFRDLSVQPRLDLGLGSIALEAGPYDSSANVAVPFDLQLQAEGGAPGSLQAAGRLLPTNPLQSSEVKVTTKGIPLRPFAGYLVKAIGQPATGGTVSGDLHCQLRNGLIEAGNQFEIHRIELGPRVENSKAPHLPVELALAVLEDRRGIITLDIPVKGDLRNPEFSLGNVITQALQNVIEKVVAAPFDILGGLLPGGDGSKPKPIEFEAGADKLPKGAERTLESVAELMLSRPRLELQLIAGYSARKDGEAWSKQRFEERLAARMAKGEERKEAIKALHSQLPKEQQVTGWHFRETDKMEAAVRQSLVASDKDLRQLAERRGQAVIQSLTGRGIEAQRMKVVPAPKEGDREVAFDFGLEK